MSARPDQIAARVRALRPTAKFLDVSHSRDFIEPMAKLGEGFFKANLYDENIDANLMSSPKLGHILVENTYLSSFTFNLFLCWIGSYTRAPGLAPLDVLLAHNFKKFFAEQVYRLVNRVPSRALLLETLLYEQVHMVPVFAAKDDDAQLSKDSDTATEMMSLSLAMHELGHYMLATQPTGWASFLVREPEIIGPLYLHVYKNFDPVMTDEFRCDLYAVMGCLGAFKGYGDPNFAFRTLAFSYCAYAVLYSILRTAEATAELWRNLPETVDLRDISRKPYVEHDVGWARDDAFIQRAAWVVELCEKFAAREGLSLFGEDYPFPLPRTILQDLLAYVGRVTDCTDTNARGMSNLVAESLSQSEEGMEYLYLRSKTFRSNRDEPLTVYP